MNEELIIKKLRNRVEGYLREIVGSYQVTRTGDYTFRHGSTRIMIHPSILGDMNKSILQIIALTVMNVDVNDDLIRYINDLNSRVYFGKFIAMKPEKMVVCTHSLLGDKLDKEEFLTGVAAVAFLSDKYDDEIVKKFGGIRAIDFETGSSRGFPGGYAGKTVEEPR